MLRKLISKLPGIKLGADYSITDWYLCQEADPSTIQSHAIQMLARQLADEILRTPGVVEISMADDPSNMVHTIKMRGILVNENDLRDSLMTAYMDGVNDGRQSYCPPFLKHPFPNEKPAAD